MTEYIVRPKSSAQKVWAGCPRVCLGISLGNSNERGDKLLSVVKWMNANFQEAIIDLSDTLYRWNEYAPDGRLAVDNEARSRAQGDRWLAENRDVLTKLAVPYKVIRWDAWLRHPEFDTEYNNFKNLYSGDGEFRKNIDQDVEKFLLRQKRHGFVVDQVMKKNCLSFLFEELAAHTILYRTFSRTAQAYPGDSLNAAAAIRTGKIPDAPIGLQSVPFVALRVERAGSHLALLADIPAPIRTNRKGMLP